MARLHWTHVLAPCVLIGCGSVDDVDTMMAPEPDVQAPEVASSLPGPAGVGVPADAAIAITFSEPMNIASVEAAYSSADLTVDAVSFSWNTEGTILTITPNKPLDYASGFGTDPSTVAARQYAVSIGAGATDLAGNPLAAPYALTFATKRRMVASIATIGDLTRVARDTQVLSLANPIWVGDTDTAATYRSYLTFDLSALPPSTEIEFAEFLGRQLAPTNSPYNLGTLVAEHVTFPQMTDAMGASALGGALVFSTNATAESKRVEVTADVQDDIENRASRSSHSQFRLRFEQATNSNGNTDTAVFAKDTFAMSIVYVAD
jgi:hypothetical protein